jgi:hypothetical protein
MLKLRTGNPGGRSLVHPESKGSGILIMQGLGFSPEEMLRLHESNIRGTATWLCFWVRAIITLHARK